MVKVRHRGNQFGVALDTVTFMTVYGNSYTYNDRTVNCNSGITIQ